MKEMMTVREAVIGDAPAINELSRCLGYAALNEDVLMLNFGHILAASSDKLWVCEQEKKIVGWIHVFSAYRVASRPTIEIGGLVVDRASRRQGLGRKLVAQARQWAGEQNRSLRVRCNTSREDTHKFYESVGFVLSKSQNVFEFRC